MTPVVAPGLVTMSSQVSARQALFADRFAGRVSWASVGNEWRLLVAAKKDADLLQIAEDEALRLAEIRALVANALRGRGHPRVWHRPHHDPAATSPVRRRECSGGQGAQGVREPDDLPGQVSGSGRPEASQLPGRPLNRKEPSLEPHGGSLGVSAEGSAPLRGWNESPRRRCRGFAHAYTRRSVSLRNPSERPDRGTHGQRVGPVGGW